MVAQSSAEAEYRAMAHTSSELTWVKHFLELRFEVQLYMDIYCDNKVVVHVASNPVFHDWTKHRGRLSSSL